MSFTTILLLLITAVTIGVLLWRARRSPLLARIGWRNVVRRGLRTTLIIFGLMLATTLITTALAINDTLVVAVKTVATANIGRVDEAITGGSGSLGLFPAPYATQLRQHLQHDPHVADVAGALLVQNTLVVDQTSRQAHGAINTIAFTAGPLGALTGLHDLHGRVVSLAALAPQDIAINDVTAGFLSAKVGDTLALFSPYWPQQRYQLHVHAIVAAGPLGKRPTIFIALPTLQQMAVAASNINRIFIANAGDRLASNDYSDAITARARAALPAGLVISADKAKALAIALQAQDIFGRILTLYTLFALAIDLLLIFLIFSLLAAERRSELGVVRALGLHRADVIEMLLFEASVYDGLAALPGMLTGLGLGILIILIIGPEVAHLGFPLSLSLDPQNVIVALTLGFLFTLAVALLAAWVVSRMTIAAAMRGEAEVAAPPAPLPILWQTVLAYSQLQRATIVALLRAWRELAWGVTWRGVIPTVVGFFLVIVALGQHIPLIFSLGLACLMGGGVLLLRWLALVRIDRRAATTKIDVVRLNRIADRVSALLVGSLFILYWALPFDVLQWLGIARFDGGIEVVFTAGVMMVFGAVLAITPNLDLLLGPLRYLFAAAGRLRHVIYIAFIYPAYQRFRTGIGLALFSLVCFTMVVMACVAASTTQHFDNLNDLASGYDIIGQPLFAPLSGVQQVHDTIVHAAPATASKIVAISSAASLPIGVIQPDATQARWQLYPVAALQGAFLEGVGLPLVARAQGYADDAAVWQAVRTVPGTVVIDVGALSQQDRAALGVKPPPPITIQQYAAPPIASSLLGPAALDTVLNRPDAQALLKKSPPEVRALLTDPVKLQTYTLKLSDILTPDHTLKPTSLWLADFRGGAAHPVKVVGLVDNAYGQRFGLLGAPATFAPIEGDLPDLGNAYYYFKLKPGADVPAAARAIGSALLDSGFETTVIHQALLDLNAPRVFASRVIERLVSLMLLVGTAALMVTGMRSVVERRQQIGMLRALGFHQIHIQALFAIESLVVAAGGALIGLTLGVVLCNNAFGAGVFEQSQASLALVIPWAEIAVIEISAVIAALVAVALPAWQAGRITPAEALRYE